MSESIRLLVVDDHTLFRRGLAGLLGEQPDFLVIGEAENGTKAVDLCRQLQPDVVLMDVHMPGGDGVEAARVLKVECKIGLIMLTISDKDSDLLRALRAGADGYLLKSADLEQLCQAIRQVVAGHGALSPEITTQVMRAVARDQSQPVLQSLSPREREVLAELASGATTAEIASTLFISINTSKTHIRRILKKLKAANRAEAVARAINLGLIPGSSR